MYDGIGVFAYWIAIGLLFVGVTFGPIGTALGRAVEAIVGRLFGSGGARRSAELEQLRERVAALQGVEQRLLEVEERLDFAERLLTSGRRDQGTELDTPPEPVDAAR